MVPGSGFSSLDRELTILFLFEKYNSTETSG